MDGMAAGFQMSVDLRGGGDAADADEAEGGFLRANDFIEEADLGERGLVNGRTGNAARLALEERAVIAVDYFCGNAVHHDERVCVRGEGLDKRCGERFVGDVADFDEQWF